MLLAVGCWLGWRDRADVALRLVGFLKAFGFGWFGAFYQVRICIVLTFGSGLLPVFLNWGDGLLPVVVIIRLLGLAVVCQLSLGFFEGEHVVCLPVAFGVLVVDGEHVCFWE